TSKEEENLNRYESFEVILGDFERMLILKRFVDENRKQQTGIGQETDTLQTQWEEQLKRLKQQMEEFDKLCKPAKGAHKKTERTERTTGPHLHPLPGRGS
ncbi:MAG: hypothetical protein UHS50_05195, partial [Bacteroidaceae bacterium]|nr:hypothetical protein [Bacteroidaceae bacterium]